MRIMIIDIGSNTVKYNLYHIAEREFRSLGGDTRAVGMLNYIENGVLSEEGERRLFSVLREYTDTARSGGCDGVYCLATAGFRAIGQSGGLVNKIVAAFGVNFEILTGEREAELSFLGFIENAPSLNDTNGGAREGIMLDLGGASTEATLFIGRKRMFSTSLPFGALRLKNNYLPNGDYPNTEQSSRIRSDVRAVIDDAVLADRVNVSVEHAYIVGGTARAIGKLYGFMRNPSRADHDVYCDISISEYDFMLAELAKMPPEIDAWLRSEFPDRHRLLIPGVLAFRELFAALGCETIHVSCGGIRDGFAASIAASIGGVE